MQNKQSERIYHILVVSCSEQFDSVFRNCLPEQLLLSLEFRKNVTLARQRMLEKQYDIVVINAPLPDENGLDFALDTAEKGNTGILVAAPSEIYEMVLEHVTDYGILAISKPDPDVRIGKALRFLLTVQDRMRNLEAEILSANERLEELRTVSRAKFLLMERKHLTEDEAHRLIGKQAMDRGVTRKRIAEEIIEDYE